LKPRAHKPLPADAADFTLGRLNKYETSTGGEYAQNVANDIRASMQRHAGVFRTQAMMDAGVVEIKKIAERVKNIHLADKSKVFNTARIEALEVENLIEVAMATMISAAARHESRGAHTVDDYANSVEFPNGRNDKEWLRHTLWYSAGNRLDYKPVNLKPLTADSIPPVVRTF
jgi:succinate dehydrogenase / fumarate reductase flavoprotein subunit